MWTSPCDSIGEIAGTFSGCKFISSVRGALEMLLVCVSHGISKGHETNVSLCFLPQGVYLLNVALHQQSVHLHNSCCAAIFLKKKIPLLPLCGPVLPTQVKPNRRKINKPIKNKTKCIFLCCLKSLCKVKVKHQKEVALTKTQNLVLMNFIL